MIEFSSSNSAESMDRLTCSICMEVVRHPKETPCEHTFCQKCLMDWIKISPTCPICRQPMQARDVKDAPRRLKSELSSLKVRCTFHSRGCDEEMELKDLSRHEEVCGFRGPKCSLTGCKRPLQQQGHSDEPVLKMKRFCGKRCLEDHVTHNYIIAYRHWTEWPNLRTLSRSSPTAEELDKRWNVLTSETTTILRELMPASEITVESNCMNVKGAIESINIYYTQLFSDDPSV
ncbi:hypothetical protein HELRODRAFT_179816 [Helobdella robusta]|uniref:RING-type domain-containing protein n=1 Tax=Helobdella robusta TaxID=6412 RepID=T1FF66_HELRO|nr:hypothetical protein HELRODRAFT_179816 [Helobdella robusta]ESN94976.1 hypothetical protein HELRODRAFT_179816 [Helobdella robusta]